MGKILNEYDGFSATVIKNRADIPMQNNITVSGSTVVCTDIKLTDVKNVIGSSSSTVGGLCSDSAVNKWSNFGPTEWYISGETLLNRVIFPYSLGNFAGYNKDAVKPSIVVKTTNLEFIETPSSFTATAVVSLGEYDFSKIHPNISRLWLKVYDDLFPIGEIYEDITTNAESTYYLHAIANSPSSVSNLNAKLYFGSLVGEVIALFPDTGSTWHINAEILTEPSMMVSPDYTTFPQFGTMMTVDLGSSVNVSTNTIYVQKDLKLIPTFSDCSGSGNFPRFNNSPLVYNADVILNKKNGDSFTFTNVLAVNQTCSTYSNIGDNANPPYQRIWFDYTIPNPYDITYGDTITVKIKRMNSTFQYGWCNNGTPVYVP